MDHKGLFDTIRGSCHSPNISKGAYETLQQQWASLPKAHHPNSWAERVSKIWHSVCNLRADIIRSNTS